ncbi:MAG: tetratricopeptide repeat protein [Alphaproteobacteria bacterium]
MLSVKRREFPIQKPHIYDMALAAEKNADYAQAEQLYRMIILGEEQHIPALIGLSRSHFAQQFWLESMILLDYILSIDPAHQEAAALRGDILKIYRQQGIEIDQLPPEGSVVSASNKQVQAPPITPPPITPPPITPAPITPPPITPPPITPPPITPAPAALMPLPIMPASHPPKADKEQPADAPPDAPKKRTRLRDDF